MAYNSQITRENIGGLIPEDVSREIIQNVPEQSAIMRLARKLPNMTTRQRRLPVLSGLVEAYFVTGDTGLKQTSKAEWGNKYINAEELAVIVPIPENVIDDAGYPLWDEIRPRIFEAFGKAFDMAVLYGVNAPSDWPANLLAGATSAGNTVTLGTGTDLYDDIMGENGTLAKVEADGYMVDGHVATMTMRSKLRGLRDANGVPIFVRTMQAATQYELDGAPVEFPRSGIMDANDGLMFSGDWNQLVYSVRQDVTFKMLTESVIQDAAGNIIYNLAQQDMVALRAVMRLGWQLPNPINHMQPTEANRYPFAVLLP